jgi:tetratricopeptide (TPR) repeat protein
MPWSMNWSRSTSWALAVAGSALAAFLLLGVSPASAQDVEQRYQQAVDFFNSAKMEDACELLQQVDKEKPGYKQTKTYMSAACSQVKRMVTMEESLFNEGVQFFNQSRYDDAKQKFEQAAKIPLKNPKYRSQISRYLRDMESRQNEEQLFQEGVRLFNEGKYSEAQSRLNQVAQGGGPKAADARSYLGRVDEALRRQRAEEEINKLFNAGVQLFNAGKYVDALTNFETVAKSSSPKAGEARSYLQRIEQSSRAQQQPPKPQPGKEVAVTRPPVTPPVAETKPAPPVETPKPVASEQTLRAGLRAYFEGDINRAEQDLSEYLNNNGPKQALAHFFRGAARSTRFVLSGEKDVQQKELAVADFRALKGRAAHFQPPQKFVSPKILALYTEAVGAP